MTQKTLNNSDTKGAKTKVTDLETVGNCDMWKLLCKASSASEGWMKSTKAMEFGNGCLVQVTTQQGDHVAEAITFVPNVYISKDDNGGRKLELIPPVIRSLINNPPDLRED